MSYGLPNDWYIEHSGERRILDQEKVAAEIERLRAALNAAAYALFEIKRMQPDMIREHAAAAHAKACAVLDGDEQKVPEKP